MVIVGVEESCYGDQQKISPHLKSPVALKLLMSMNKEKLLYGTLLVQLIKTVPLHPAILDSSFPRSPPACAPIGQPVLPSLPQRQEFYTKHIGASRKVKLRDEKSEILNN